MSSVVERHVRTATAASIQSARDDVEPYRGLRSDELARHIRALCRLELRARMRAGYREGLERLRELEDPGRWWERVPYIAGGASLGDQPAGG